MVAIFMLLFESSRPLSEANAENQVHMNEESGVTGRTKSSESFTNVLFKSGTRGSCSVITIACRDLWTIDFSPFDKSQTKSVVSMQGAMDAQRYSNSEPKSSFLASKRDERIRNVIEIYQRDRPCMPHEQALRCHRAKDMYVDGVLPVDGLKRLPRARARR